MIGWLRSLQSTNPFQRDAIIMGIGEIAQYVQNLLFPHYLQQCIKIKLDIFVMLQTFLHLFSKQFPISISYLINSQTFLDTI